MDRQPNPMSPPCAEWRIWKGQEIEGTQGIGEWTLFIRSLEDFPNLAPEDCFIFKEKSGCTRVWFCKEYTLWPMIRAIGEYFDKVCIEVEPKCYDSIPKDLRRKATIYLKVKTPLKDGDFVCVGPAFSDESFEIGTGAKVTPEAYLKDKRIK